MGKGEPATGAGAEYPPAGAEIGGLSPLSRGTCGGPGSGGAGAEPEFSESLKKGAPLPAGLADALLTALPPDAWQTPAQAAARLSRAVVPLAAGAVLWAVAAGLLDTEPGTGAPRRDQDARPHR